MLWKHNGRKKICYIKLNFTEINLIALKLYAATFCELLLGLGSIALQML